MSESEIYRNITFSVPVKQRTIIQRWCERHGVQQLDFLRQLLSHAVDDIERGRNPLAKSPSQTEAA